MLRVVAVLVAGTVVGCAAQPTITGSVGFQPPKETAIPLRTVEVEKAEPPQGWTEFCVQNSAECDVKSADPRVIALTHDTWAALVDVNRSVNAHVRPATARQLWGFANEWHYPTDGQGDCKSYVLLKRRRLIEAGFPGQALLITIVWTKEATGHAVLIARTDRGDFVLDNLSSEVQLAYATDYSFVKRQSPFDANAWVYIDGNPSRQGRTVAPLRVAGWRTTSMAQHR
jgi:predicted transglutaminase-like cysteine proteinase